LFKLLDNRLGGCLVASSSSAPPLWGLWHRLPQTRAEKDYRTTAEVLANPSRRLGKEMIKSTAIVIISFPALVNLPQRERSPRDEVVPTEAGLYP
jgi:hypothetical protein